ncbi:MAG: hypothetical protein Kow0029_25350 [Candidatus Rifleibacteriota bacterium]
MHSYTYFAICLVSIVVLFWSAPMNPITLSAGIFLLFAVFICIKSTIIDQKNLNDLCTFYEKIQALDDLHLLNKERPYQKILDFVTQFANFDWAALFLMDFDNDCFRAVETSGIDIEKFTNIRFDDIEACENADVMQLSLKLLEYAFRRYELKGALAGSALEKNGVYYGCLLVGRYDSEAFLSESDSLRLNILSDQIAIILHNYRMHNEIAFRAEQLAESQARLNKELQMAKVVQDGAIFDAPREFANLKLASYIQPTHFVGGDFLKFFPAPDSSKLALLIGDVCGKGVPAALIMAVVICLFQEKYNQNSDPAELMSRVNVSLKQFLGAGSHFNSSALFGIFNPETGIFKYASAGHDFPLFYKASVDKIYSLESTGTLLGIFSESTFSSKEYKLESNDRLMFYSDGLVDFFETSFGVEDGFPVLEDFFYKRKFATSEEIVNEIKQMVETETRNLQDDITVAVIAVD